MRSLICLLLIIVLGTGAEAQQLRVDDGGRFLVQSDGTPFFWLADTAWELFHRCDREEVDYYLEKRATQGFNVVQAVALAELDGLNTPNPYGAVPLLEGDPLRPNDEYFTHVDYVIDRADSLGMYIALLPTWGDKLYRDSWGVGPEIFTPANAESFGQWIGDRYKDRDNLIWVVGGDRNPRADSRDVEVWNALAKGITAGVGEGKPALMSFHPQPKEAGGSSTWFHEEAWLDFNMHQTGHCNNQATYEHIAHDYQLSPTKPVIDAEPLYEEHPNCFNARELGYSVASDIRRIMYWNVFAGAFGQTYGCHDVWQMFKLDKKPINQPLRPWKKALDLPMANQVKHLKALMLSRPFLSRIPDQSLVVGSPTGELERIVATRSSDGSYAMVYFPQGGSAQLDLGALASEQLSSWWYDPRTGNAIDAGDLTRSDNLEVQAPTSGKGHDWVLVLDAETFSPPGVTD